MLSAALALFLAAGASAGEKVRWDLSAAPEAIRVMVAPGMPGSAPKGSDAFWNAAKPVKLLGKKAVPWLRTILLASPRELHPQVTTIAAMYLADMGEWGVLLEGLAEADSIAARCAAGAFDDRLMNRKRGEIEKYLPRIEKLARASPRVEARIAAMDVLAQAGDARYVEVCRANLTADSELDPLATKALREALTEFERACEEPGSERSRMMAMQCLSKLGDPASASELLAYANLTGNGMLRQSAIEALNAVAKQNFGALEGGQGTAWGRCQARRTDVLKLLRLPAASSGAVLERLGGIVTELRGVVEHDLRAGAKDAETLAAWNRWMSSGRLRPEDLVDGVVATQSKPGGPLVTLFGSGKVEVTGPQPGGGAGGATFNDLDGFAGYVETMLKSSNPDVSKPAISRWILDTAAPALREAQKRHRASQLK